MQKRTAGKGLEVSALGLRRMSLTSAYDLREGRNGQPSAEQIGVALALDKGITNGPEGLKQLRALLLETIVDGSSMATMFTARSTYSDPMIDGTIVVDELHAKGSEYLLNGGRTGNAYICAVCADDRRLEEKLEHKRRSTSLR
jgi:hypothetical protein